MLASFDFDQAEGLRRMLAGPKPRIVTFLSATPQDDKGAMLVNLGASLAQSGNDVLIVDACTREYGVAQRLGETPALIDSRAGDGGADHGIGFLRAGTGLDNLVHVLEDLGLDATALENGHVFHVRIPSDQSFNSILS